MIKFLFLLILLLFVQVGNVAALRFQVQQFMIGGSGSGAGGAAGQGPPCCVGDKCSANKPCPCAHAECQRFRCVCQENTREVNGQCVSFDNGELGEACLPGKKCKPENSECYRAHCLCKKGYYEFGDQCKDILGETCSTRLDCFGENMECIRKRCVCNADDGYIEINDHCVEETSWAACRIQTDPNQYCNSVIYESICNSTTGCICPPDYTEILGECKQNNRCNISSDCEEFIRGSECEDGFCVCPNATHNVNGRCIPDNWCITDSDCTAELVGAVCDNYVCSCGEGFKEEYGRCIPDKWCVEDSECYDHVINSTCEEYLCKCPIDYMEHGNACLPMGNGTRPHPHPSGCYSNDDCQQQISGSWCNANHQCECPWGFNQHGSQCVRGQCDPVALGQPCWCEESCQLLTNHSYCRQIMPHLALCECNTGTFEWENQCYQQRRLGENCSLSVQCGAVDIYSMCDHDIDKCRCIHGYLDYQDKCYQDRRLGDECTVDEQCAAGVSYSTCTDSLCVCQEEYIKDSDSDTCYPIRELDESCFEDVQCLAGEPHTQCGSSSVCECAAGSIRIGEHCPPALEIGQACNFTIQCDASGTEYCNSSKICDCKAEYFYNSSFTTDACFETKDFDEICRIDEQCSRMHQGAECGSDKRCKCRSGTVKARNHDGWACWLEVDVGYQCELPAQCVVDNSQCVSSHEKSKAYMASLKPRTTAIQGSTPDTNPSTMKFCLCEYDYWSPNDTTCSLQVGFNETCNTDKSCVWSSINYMYCDNTTLTCQCTAGHFEANNTCWNESPGLYEPCLNSTYCQAKDNSTICLEGECVCDKTHVDDITCERAFNLLPAPGIIVNGRHTITSYYKYYLHEVGQYKVVNNFHYFAGYKYGQELWYEVVAPYEDPNTHENIQLKIEFSGLVITTGVVFEIYYEPGLSMGKVSGNSNDEIKGTTFITPFSRALFRLNTGSSNGWGFNCTVTAMVVNKTKMCDETVDLRKKPPGYTATIKNADSGSTSGYMHCFYHVYGHRNTIIEYTILEYNLDTNGLSAPDPKLILSEKVVTTDVMTDKISTIVYNKTYLLYPDEMITVTIPFSGLGKVSSSSTTYLDAKLTYKATARAVLYTEGRECGSDVMINCTTGETYRDSTPEANGTDSKLCIWTFAPMGRCSLNLTIYSFNITSPYSIFEVYSGSINNTRPYEFPHMVQYTNFMKWFYTGATKPPKDSFTFEEAGGYIVTRVGKGTPHVQASFTVSVNNATMTRTTEEPYGTTETYA